jgi:hypothetical protein
MRLAHPDDHDRPTTDRIGAEGEARGQTRTSWTSEEAHLTSTDFASVFHALAGGPMTVVEIETHTGVVAKFVEEVVRVLTLTGDVVAAGDHVIARNRALGHAASIGGSFHQGLDG